jgi:hypothetical protein
LFHRLRVQAINHQASLYADDMVLLLSPVITDLQLFWDIFFSLRGGFWSGVQHCQVSDGAHSVWWRHRLSLPPPCVPCQVMEFSLKYLGIPLSVRKLPKAALQPLVDRATDKLPAWKGGLMQHSGRVALIKSTLSVISVYTSIGVGLQPWLIKALEKIMKAFLWMGTEEVKAGKCVVAWCHVQSRPLVV